MNPDEFETAYRGYPSDIAQIFQQSDQRIKDCKADKNHKGRLMLASGLASIVFAGIAFAYASRDNTQTAAYCGAISGALALGAYYSRQKAGEAWRLENQLILKHIPIKAAHQEYLKQQDLNQKRSHGHQV